MEYVVGVKERKVERVDVDDVNDVGQVYSHHAVMSEAPMRLAVVMRWSLHSRASDLTRANKLVYV
jgi:hypothetical protein